MLTRPKAETVVHSFYIKTCWLEKYRQIRQHTSQLQVTRSGLIITAFELGGVTKVFNARAELIAL